MTSRRVVLEGDICFSFSFFCTRRPYTTLSRRREEGERPKKGRGQNFFFVLSFAWENKFSSSSRAVGFTRVRVVSIEHRWWFDAHRFFFEGPDLYTDPFSLFIIIILTKQLAQDIDLLNPPAALEASKHKLKRLVQGPNSFFMDVKCQGCFSITTVFSHSQTVVLCGSCSAVLCQPTGGKARLTEGCSFRKKTD